MSRSKEQFDPFDGDCPYKALGVSSSATKEDIKNAFRRQAMIWHPDRRAKRANTDSDGGVAMIQFQKIQNAHELLSNPKRRQTFDLLKAHATSQRLRTYRTLPEHHHGFEGKMMKRHAEWKARTSTPTRAVVYLFALAIPCAIIYHTTDLLNGVLNQKNSFEYIGGTKRLDKDAVAALIAKNK